MKKFKIWVSDKKNKMLLAATSAAPIFMVVSGAADADVTTVTTALTTAATTIAGNVTSAISAVLPILLGVVGLSLLITFVLKFIKRIVGKA